MASSRRSGARRWTTPRRPSERAVPPVEPVAERAARAQAPDRRDVPVPVGVRQRPQRRRRRAPPPPRTGRASTATRRRPRRAPPSARAPRPRRRSRPPLDHALERRVPVLAPRRHARAPSQRLSTAYRPQLRTYDGSDPCNASRRSAASSHSRWIATGPRSRSRASRASARASASRRHVCGAWPPRSVTFCATSTSNRSWRAARKAARSSPAAAGRASLARRARHATGTRRARRTSGRRGAPRRAAGTPPRARPAARRRPPRGRPPTRGARQEVERQARVALRFQPLRGGLLDAALQRVVGRRREAVRVAVPVRRSRSSRVRVRVREALVAPDGRGRARARGAGDDARGGREVVPVARELGVPPDAPSAGGAPRTRQSTGGPRSRTQRRASAARGPPPPPPPARRRSTKATCAASGRRARSPRRRGTPRARAVADAAVVRAATSSATAPSTSAAPAASRGAGAVEGLARDDERPVALAGAAREREAPALHDARRDEGLERPARERRRRAVAGRGPRAGARARARAGRRAASRRGRRRRRSRARARRAPSGARGRAPRPARRGAVGRARPSAAGFPRRPRRPPRGRTGPRRRRRGRAAARPAPPAPATRAPPRPPPRRPRRRRTRAPRPRPRAGPAARAAQLRARDEVAQRELGGAVRPVAPRVALPQHRGGAAPLHDGRDRRLVERAGAHAFDEARRVAALQLGADDVLERADEGRAAPRVEVRRAPGAILVDEGPVVHQANEKAPLSFAVLQQVESRYLLVPTVPTVRWHTVPYRSVPTAGYSSYVEIH